MKIAVLGGSFNPLHIGHAMLAESVVHDFGFDKVLFVPTGIPPHKIMNKVVSDEDRFAMLSEFCKNADVNGKEIFVAEDCEIFSKGISYTSNTLEFLWKKYEKFLCGQKFSFIMGEEVASQFYKWNNPQKVASFADFLIAKRHPDNNGVNTDNFVNEVAGNYVRDYIDRSYLDNFPYPHVFLENPVLPISSTEIRARIYKGKAFRYLVPEKVFSYIIENKLYGYKDEGKEC